METLLSPLSRIKTVRPVGEQDEDGLSSFSSLESSGTSSASCIVGLSLSILNI